ncbi:glycoside hydrolase family 16 protein [filamentous cyanobacterium LEGE 11480]|uniref:Glycoside hydrolase family 16 protein n=1 Tax=Romeriopsis navalis LEGE 11480 TaxID=2777977 RepID=A0A928VIC8_9CYAN|nr:glycoside hydrolase family 16 protein [Romeriopsis navalis]MBE9029158.1 glycoside hydrolase family 16 protein [Romeriopsis navalis LEGE 11480]
MSYARRSGLPLGLATISLMLSASVASAFELAPNYQLVWSDEFNGQQLDQAKWDYRYLGPRGPAIVAKDSVAVDGTGNLRLSTHRVGDDLHVGMIGTQPTFQTKYGYFETRIKFQEQQGHHGAFWLQSPTYGKYLDNPAQSGAEIDVIEFFGSGRHDRGAGNAVFWNPYANGPEHRGGPPDLTPILGPVVPGEPRAELSDKFHTYGLLWTADEYVFFIDDHEVFRTSEGVSQVPQYMVLSLLSSGWERSRLQDDRLPDSMYVDYVRVYQPQPPRKVPVPSMLLGLLGVSIKLLQRRRAG